MANNPTLIQNEEQQSTQEQNPQFQPVGVSGSEAASSASGGPQGGPTASQAQGRPTSSGRFKNLNAYLKANKVNLAGRVNQNLSSQGNELQQSYAQAKDNYNQRLEAARQRYNPELVNNTLQNPTQASEQDVQKFAQMRDASYKGPNDLDAEGKLRADVDNFRNLADQTGTESGRFNILRQMFDRPTYTSGQQALDNLFLQVDPNQTAALQNSRVLANQLANQFGQAKTQASIAADQATKEALATRSATRNALTGAITGFDTNLEKAKADALVDRRNKYFNKQSDLNNLQLGSDEALKWGIINQLGNAQSNPIYNLNLRDYLTEGNIDPTKQSVASVDDYNKIQALQKLAGSAVDENTAKIFDMYNNPALAGSFAKESPYDFNSAAFLNDLRNADVAYHGQADPLVGQIAAYQADLTGGAVGSAGSGYEGGLLGELARRAGSLRNTLSSQQEQQLQGVSPEEAQRLGIPYVDYSALTDTDLLNQYGNKLTGTGGDVWLTQGIANVQQEKLNREHTLQQLMNAMGVNRKVNITDANQYAPVEISPDIARQLNILNNIYNR